MTKNAGAGMPPKASGPHKQDQRHNSENGPLAKDIKLAGGTGFAPAPPHWLVEQQARLMINSGIRADR